MPPTKTQRCLMLFSLLLRAGRLTTAQAMRALGENNKQKVLQDLRLLKETIPEVRHVGDGRRKSWVISSSMTLLRPTVQQAIALKLGRELTGFLSGSGLRVGMEGTSSQMLSEGLRGFQSANIDRKFCLQHEPHRDYTNQQDIVLELLDGLLRERTLRVEYQRADGTIRLHEALWPLTIVVYRWGLYLLVTREDGRVFDLAVERILSAESGEPFKYPRDWRPEIELGKRFGMISGNRPETVRIRFDAGMQPWVTCRVWHPTQTIQILEDGRVELRMRATGKELKRLALEWGEHCEVLEPAWLRQEVIKTAEKVLHRYSGEPS